MLATKAFFENMPTGIIRAALQSPNPESAAEVFAPSVHGKDNSGNYGAVIVKFEQDIFPKVVEEIPQEPGVRVSANVDLPAESRPELLAQQSIINDSV